VSKGFSADFPLLLSDPEAGAIKRVFDFLPKRAPAPIIGTPKLEMP